MENVIGIIGIVVILLGYLVFNAWIFKKDDELGIIALLFGMILIMLGIGVIGDLGQCWR